MDFLALPILLSLGAAIAVRPPRQALLAILVGCLFLPPGAGFDIGGLNLFPARLLAYIAFFRVLTRREFTWSDAIRPDKYLLALYVLITVIPLIRGGEEGALGIIARSGDGLFIYFALRGLMRSADDLRWLLGALAWLLIPYILFLFMEGVFRLNPFQYLGGEGKLWERGGRLRCFGSFRHPSLMGSFGACFLPLFAALYFDPAWRTRALLGGTLCVAMVGFSNSGGPISVLAMSLLAWCFWPLRARMRMIRRGLVAVGLLLALLMEAPVWYLLARVSSVTGGTGWHRSYLMDVAFRHFGDWWLAGLPLRETSDWMPYVLASTGGADITNQFISFALKGGIWSMLLFVGVIVSTFSLLGRALSAVRESEVGDETDERLLWGLGAALTAHVSNWLGLAYFDQFQVFWLIQLSAMIAVTQEVLAAHPADDEQNDEDEVLFGRTPVPAPSEGPRSGVA